MYDYEVSDSSSDDSVFFGPYTMEEAKRDIKKGKHKQIDHRHSSIFRFRHYDQSDSIDTITARFEEATNLSSSDDDSDIPPTPQEKKEKPYFDLLSKITEKTEFTSAPSDKSASTTDFSQNMFEIEKSPHANLPNVNQFDDSCVFDDTLEEMNRFLEEGAEYVMPEKTPEKTKQSPKTQQSSMLDEDYIYARETPKDTFRPLSEYIENSRSQDNLASRNKSPSKEATLENAKKYHSAEKVSKTKFRHVESKIKPPTSFSKALSGKTTTNSAFKRPTAPALKITPNKSIKPSLKNVVSPVAVYINNTPKYSPIMKVPQHKPHLKQPSAGPSSYKENVPVATADFDLPPVIYKPAKIKLASEVTEFNLPSNIKKLIVPRILTKHVQRIEAVDHNQSVERRLEESDLTIDASLMSNPDISILTNSQPYNIKKL